MATEAPEGDGHDIDQDLAYAKMLQEQDYAWYMMSGGDALEDDYESDGGSQNQVDGASDEAEPAREASAGAAEGPEQQAQREQHRDHLRTILSVMSSVAEGAGEGGVAPALDLEGMSYEELQSLGDAIGKVQVAVSQHKLEQLPVLLYRDAAASAEGVDTKCAVCQDALDGSDEVLVLPCSHLYHRDCIRKWLACSRNCPICNASVEEAAEGGAARPDVLEVALAAVAAADAAAKGEAPNRA